MRCVCFSKWCFLSPDPVVASLAQDIFKELAQIETCQGPMQMRLIPTLVSIMQAPADKIPAGLCAVSASVGHGLGWRCSLFCNTLGGLLWTSFRAMASVTGRGFSVEKRQTAGAGRCFQKFAFNCFSGLLPVSTVSVIPSHFAVTLPSFSRNHLFSQQTTQLFPALLPKDFSDLCITYV